MGSPPGTQAPRPQRRRRHEALAGSRPVEADEFRGSSRYELLVKIASGGSASVYIGRVTGSAGFSRLVAVKRAHPHLAHDPAVERMMTTEARLASSLNHANVVAVQDVEHTGSELLLILDYVEGASLAELHDQGALRGVALPSRVAVRIALDACAGLAAVHEIEGKDGRPVGFLHRDVSPQNILVGVDGTARITDFGLAKHICSDSSKASGTLQGKLAYLAPEVIDHSRFSVQSDLFAMGVVVWEALAGRRLFQGDSWADTVRKVGLVTPPPLSRIVPALGKRLDGTVARALDKVAARRHPTVRDFAQELEEIALRQGLVATSSEVARYVQSVVGETLRRRRELIRSLQGDDDAIDDLLATQTVTIVRPAPAQRSAQPAGSHGWPSPRELPPTPARRPAPAVELSSSDIEIVHVDDNDDDDNESTLSRHDRPDARAAAPASGPSFAAPIARPAPLAVPVAEPAQLARHAAAEAARELDEETDGTTGARPPSPPPWTGDPLAPWVPPSVPPPAPARRIGLIAGVAALGACAALALLTALGGATPSSPGASAATRPAAAMTAGAGPIAASPVAASPAAATPIAASPAAASPAPEPAAITPHSLPDARGAASAITPDSLPDARGAAPAKPGAITPDSLPDAPPRARAAPPAPRRKARPSLYR